MRRVSLLFILWFFAAGLGAQAPAQSIESGQTGRVEQSVSPTHESPTQGPRGPVNPDEWHSYEEALTLAKKEQDTILLYVHAPWCGPCRKLERDVLPHLAMNGVIKAAFDPSDRQEPGFANEAIESLRSQGLDIPPTLALIEPGGQVKASIRGYHEVPVLALFLTLAETR